MKTSLTQQQSTHPQNDGSKLHRSVYECKQRGSCCYQYSASKSCKVVAHHLSPFHGHPQRTNKSFILIKSICFIVTVTIAEAQIMRKHAKQRNLEYMIWKCADQDTVTTINSTSPHSSHIGNVYIGLTPSLWVSRLSDQL